MDIVRFDVSFRGNGKTYHCDYNLRLPAGKRPTLQHIARDGHIRGFSVFVKNFPSDDIFDDLTISNVVRGSSSFWYGLTRFVIDDDHDDSSRDTDAMDGVDDVVYDTDSVDDVYDTDAADAVDSVDDADSIDARARLLAQKLRFGYSLDSDPHAGCYCKTRNVCGCGCDSDHDGW